MVAALVLILGIIVAIAGVGQIASGDPIWGIIVLLIGLFIMSVGNGRRRI